MSTEPVPTPVVPELDVIELERELKKIRQAQLSGAWSPGDKAGSELEAHETMVQQKVKRAIEILSLQRRSNTGPAKAKGRGKKSINLEALNSEMLA